MYFADVIDRQDLVSIIAETYYSVLIYMSYRQLISLGVTALLIPMLCVIGVGYLDCNTAALAIVLLVMQDGFNAAAAAGYPVSRIDIAPQ